MRVNKPSTKIGSKISLEVFVFQISSEFDHGTAPEYKLRKRAISEIMEIFKHFTQITPIT